jgi:LmbE family N-acetylglucosaminyl deacetylase
MNGWSQNDHPGAFVQAPVDEAAERLATVLREEQAEVFTTYDWHGNYGHPDHVRVHVIGHRAAELAGVTRVYEATMNRDEIKRFMDQAREMGAPDEDVFDPDSGMDDGNPMGTPEAEITTAVDVSAYVAVKRASIRCHASQITDTSFFSQMPDEQFAAAFGTEWFIRVGAPKGIHESWLFG